MRVKEMMKSLKAENVKTWFDLGLFIDRVKEDRNVPSSVFSGSFDDFKDDLGNGGIGFLTFYFSVDGITVEVQKYTKAFRAIVKDIPVHYIAGEILPEASQLIDDNVHIHTIEEINGFDKWKLYKDFYSTHLERGSKEYNALIGKYWEDVLQIAQKIGSYVEKNDLKLLYLVNVCSNPGNVSLALATVLVSEYMGIPVINNNHDFYWEGGNREVDITTNNLKRGPRDFFFKNSHIGEFFSQIEVLFPWESRSWMTVNINKDQSDHVIEKNGHNPANVSLIETCVDTNRYTTLTKRNSIKAAMQVQDALRNYKEKCRVYKPSDVESKQLVRHDLEGIKPILLGGKKTDDFDFINDNIVFLQPTRVISRKKIELNFKLIGKIFQNEAFATNMSENPKLTITILVSGPIPNGQYPYFIKLVQGFEDLLKSLDPEYRERVFMGFLFSEFDKQRFTDRYEHPIGIPELYNIASLILLPSETEGRGLPIIESTACGIPIFCRRYYPENVYAQVIGEHLSEDMRLKVLEFSGTKIPDNIIVDIVDYLFHPQNHIDIVNHNREVVFKRYSLDALQRNIDTILNRLYLQLKPNKESYSFVGKCIDEYKEIVSFRNDHFRELINEDKRHYLPGHGRLAFMHYLKSLIDPSFFRVEEQETRGVVLKYARMLENDYPERDNEDLAKLHEFYNLVDTVFSYYRGDFEIRHDHSYAYRHRNTKYYPFHDFTVQELTGLVFLIYNKIIHPKDKSHFDITPHFFNDWKLAFFQLTNSAELAIDDRDRLVRKFKENVPIGYFPGRYMKYELESIVLQPIRSKLNLETEDELTEGVLRDNLDVLQTIYIFIHEKKVAKWYSAAVLEEFLKTTLDRELNLLYKYGIIKIIKTKQICIGLHFAQLGKKALEVLCEIKAKNGFIITNGHSAPVMTDIVNLDRFHIGKADEEISAKIMGIPIDSGFIQFVPAGVRTTLAYPTPIQTSKDFSEALNSKLFAAIANKLGEKEIFKRMREDAEEKGNPINEFLKSLKDELSASNKKQLVKSSFVSGVYADGFPWNGVIAEVNVSDKSKKWNFVAYTAKGGPKPVPELVKTFEKETGDYPVVAWNGGYILNPELVGKLGLPETYIGSPLGLLIIDGKIESAPLFNKPAFIIYKDGSLDIQKVNCRNGIELTCKENTLSLAKNTYNKNDKKEACYFDLMYEKEEIIGDGRVVMRMAGNIIKEIIRTNPGQNIPIIPVGLTISVPESSFPENWMVNDEIEIKMKDEKGINWSEISYAVEAGPMLVDNKSKCIDMDVEGWKTDTSIRTQAARLDYLDMRGPKIAVGLDKDGNMLVLAVNGRIRESVGATHIDMADIMVSFNMVKAMGFDPGGSSTLVVDGEAKNISPYNKRYEENIHSLSPEPRFVANAVFGIIE